MDAAAVAAESVVWPIKPVVPGDWKTLSPGDACALISCLSVNELRDGMLPSAGQVEFRRVRAMPLRPFPQWFLIEADATLHTGESAYLTLLFGPNGYLVAPHWQPRFARALWQASQPDKLDDGVMQDYLRLFVNITGGEQGRFAIVESVDDLHLLPGTEVSVLPDHARQIGPMVLSRAEPDLFLLRVTGYVVYLGQLFQATFGIEETGEVLMIEDEPIGSVPVLLEVPHGAFRLLREPPPAESPAEYVGADLQLPV